MDLNDTPEQAQYRAKVRAWLQEHKHEAPPEQDQDDAAHVAARRAWQGRSRADIRPDPGLLLHRHGAQPDRLRRPLTRHKHVVVEAVDAQRAGKRGVALPLSGDDYDTACPPLGDQVVVPVDSDGNGRFDLLRVLIPPYGAGPYAEGVYQIELKVDAATLASIAPYYRSSFEAYPQ